MRLTIIQKISALYIPCLVIAGHHSEPPFPPSVVAAIEDLSFLPSLINASNLLAGFSAADIAAFLASAINTKDSQPNPIAHTFPNLTTGTINSSTVILPIPFGVARSIVPSKYGILKTSIRKIIPFFPENSYPLVLSTQIDHDIQTEGVGIPDFSSAQFRFPFVDLLGDGFSTFSYIPTILISDNLVAIAGSEAYAEKTIVSTFDPPKDPYASMLGTHDGSIYVDVYRNIPLSAPVLRTKYVTQAGRYGEIGEYPLSFYTNVTNQPTFGCANSTCLLTCDNMIRFFHTNITSGRFSPKGISGSVELAPSAKSGVKEFPSGRRWRNVHGLKSDVAFIGHGMREPCLRLLYSLTDGRHNTIWMNNRNPELGFWLRLGEFGEDQG